MHHGPETVGGDKFRLGELMDTGEKLFGPSGTPVHLELASVVQTGAATLATYVRRV